MKSEYDWLLEFYIQIVAFSAVTSTFINLSEEDKLYLNSGIEDLRKRFDEILPKVQNKERGNLYGG